VLKHCWERSCQCDRSNLLLALYFIYYCLDNSIKMDIGQTRRRVRVSMV